jgi:hypothetical protein
MEMKLTDAHLDVGTCFGPLDAILYALGRSEILDVIDQGEDYVRDTVRLWLRDKLEDVVITNANKSMSVEEMADALGCNRDAVTGEYLAGDWADIEAPESFNAFLYEMRKSLANDFQSFIEGEDVCDIPPALAAILRDSLVDEAEEARELLGRQATEDACCLIGDELRANNVNYDQKTNTLTIEWDEDAIREFYAYDLEDEASLPSAEDVQMYFTEKIKNKIADRQQEEKNRQWKREEAQKFKAEKEQAALEAKKQEARERKKAATTKPLT